MKKLKHTLLATTILFAIVGCTFGIRSLGLKEAKELKAKRQAEVTSFWENYSDAKNGDSSLAKTIKEDFVSRMSQEDSRVLGGKEEWIKMIQKIAKEMEIRISEY